MFKVNSSKVLARLLSVVVAVVLILSYIPQTAFAAGDSYTTFTLYQNGAYTKIGVMSDLHLEETQYNRGKFILLMQKMKEQFDPDILFICGDSITTENTYAQPPSGTYPAAVGSNFTSVYDEIRHVANYYLGAGSEFPIIIIPGNHDSNICASKSGYSSYYGLVPTQNFDVFLFGAAPNAYQDYSTEEINALKSYLDQKQATDPNKPVFIMAHFPFDDDEAPDRNVNSSDVTAVKAALAGHTQPIVFIWGHSHNTTPRDAGTAFANLLVDYPDGYTTVNAGSNNYRTSGDNISQGLEMTLALNAGTLTYQMQKIDTSSGTGTIYATKTQSLPASEPGAEIPSISAQPADATVDIGEDAALSVTASISSTTGTLSYQWFSNGSDSSTGGTAVAGAPNAASFAADTLHAGMTYYYCVVTNTDTVGGATKTASVASRAAKVTVNDPSIVYGSKWGGTAASAYAGGTGASDDPYLIANGEQLAYLAQQVNAGNDYSGQFFRQTADIDLDSHAWTPIGIYAASGSGSNHAFTGTYDGDGYITSNLYIHQSFQGSDTTNKSFGLFGNMNGTIKNLGLVDVSIDVTNTATGSSNNTHCYAGGLAGYIGTGSTSGNVYNSFVTGSVSAAESGGGDRCDAGGLAGYFYGGSIVNSYAAVHAVVGGASGSESGAGGLVGYIYSSASDPFTSCCWNSDVTAGTENGYNDGSTHFAGLTGMSAAAMKAADFAATLNAGRGSYKEWMADTASLNGGYPIHYRTIGSTPSDAETPSITDQPDDITVAVGGTAALTVAAHVGSGTLSYQWYRTDTRTTTGGTAVGTNSPGYSAPTASAGTSYYYCVVTNTDTSVPGNQTATAKSNSAQVVVGAANIWDGSTASGFAGGTGTSGDPYLIATGAQLAYLASQVNGGTDYSGKYFRQTADIDLNSLTWTPIGAYYSSGSGKAFAGTYDGDGFIISNLAISLSASKTGSSDNRAYALFGYLTGTVQNLSLINANVSFANTGSANAYAGGIAGYLGYSEASGYIYNSYVRGTFSANISSGSNKCAAGGLAAYFSAGSIVNSYSASTATISSSHASSSGAGSLVGYAESGAFSSSAPSYWDSTVFATGANDSGGSTVSNTTGKSTGDMKAAAFVTLLNSNRGTYKRWMPDTLLDLNEGYPIHARPVPVENAETPGITDQPNDISTYLHSPAVLSIAASVTQGSLSYQWYRNTSKSNTGGTRINGATGTSYAASTATAGSSYYYCVVTNFDSLATVNQTARTASDAVEVTVGGAPAAWDGTTKTAPIGSGTESDPYQVWTGANLAWMADQVNNGSSQTVFDGAYFMQMADIDLGSHAWTPIGKYVSSGSTSNQRFGGIYDGNGHIIANLYVNITVSNNDTSLSKAYGLFGILYGTVKNLGVVGASVSVTNSSTSSSPLAYAGGIAGYVGTSGSSPTGYIYNSYVTGNISATGNNTSATCCAGSLGGYLARSGIENSYGAATCTISGSYSSSNSGAGGIAGRKNSSSGTTTFTNCYWDSTLTSYPMNSSTTAVSGTTGYSTTACTDGTLRTALHDHHGNYLDWTADTGLNGGYPIHVRTIITDAAAPTINTQPVGGTVVQDEPAELTVQATGSGELYYQWYSNASESTIGSTAISDANLDTYSAPTAVAGTTYYYCVVTNYDEEATGCQFTDTISDIVGVTVSALTDAEAPTVSGPEDKSVVQGQIALLQVTADGTGDLSYQWYGNDNDTTPNGDIITGATGASYSAPTGTPGTRYYYCVVTNHDESATGNKDASKTSDIATVTVAALTNAEEPTVSGPEDKSVVQGQTALLQVTASGTGVLSYQWYGNTSKSYTGGQAIDGETGETYSAPTGTVGTKYYYCAVTNYDAGATGNEYATANSDIATVTIQERSLDHIAITDPPDKVSGYIEGQTFDPAGMEVTAYYDNGDELVLGDTDYTYTTGKLAVGDNTITVAYQGKTTTLTVKAVAKSLDHIAVTHEPNQKQYEEGQTFLAAGMEITAYFDNGEHGAVTGYTCSPDGKLMPSNTQITVSYMYRGVTRTATQTIVVIGTDNTLSSLTATEGKLSPDFKADVTMYDLAIDRATGSTTIAAKANSSLATVAVSIDGAPASDGLVTLGNGQTRTVTVTVTAQNGAKREYRVAVTRAIYGALKFTCRNTTSGGILPGIGLAVYRDAMLTQYAGGGTSDASGVVTVSGLDTAIYWVTVVSVPAGYEKPVVKIPYQATDGTVTECPIDIPITKVAGLSSSQLKSIGKTAGTFSPAFDPGKYTYTLTLGEGTSQVKLTPVLADSKSKLTIDGRKVTSKTLTLKNPGDKVKVTIKVQPKSGKAGTYTITVVRAKSTNAYLSSLKASAGKLSPAFNKNTGSYMLSLSNTQGSVKLTPKVAETHAKYTLAVNGKRAAGTTVALKPGETKTAVITVKSQAGNTKTYTVKITRAISHNTNLSRLTVSKGKLQPAFTPGNTDYKLALAKGQASVTLTPKVADANSKYAITVSGKASGRTISLKKGETKTVVITVTSQAGDKKAYTIVISRAN